MTAPVFGRCVANDHDGLHVEDDGCDNWQPQRVYSAEPSHYEQLLAEVQAWRTRAEKAEMLCGRVATKLWPLRADPEVSDLIAALGQVSR
jgi:hypothetical protein